MKTLAPYKFEIGVSSAAALAVWVCRFLLHTPFHGVGDYIAAWLLFCFVIVMGMAWSKQ